MSYNWSKLRTFTVVKKIVTILQFTEIFKFESMILGQTIIFDLSLENKPDSLQVLSLKNLP